MITENLLLYFEIEHFSQSFLTITVTSFGRFSISFSQEVICPDKLRTKNRNRTKMDGKDHFLIFRPLSVDKRDFFFVVDCIRPLISSWDIHQSFVHTRINTVPAADNAVYVQMVMVSFAR